MAFLDLTAGNDLLALQPGQLANFTDGVRGLDGDDTLQGSAAGDLVFGNAGNDVLSGGDGGDVILGGRGIDLVRGETGNDTINGNNDNDYVAGGAGNDFVSGGRDDDFLDGNEGDDRLSGDFGVNFLRGGAGNDTFVFRREVAIAQATNPLSDVILDFQAGDRVEVVGGFGADELVLQTNAIPLSLVTLTPTQQQLLSSVGFTVGDLDPDKNELIDLTTIRLGATGPVLGNVINAPATLRSQIFSA